MSKPELRQLAVNALVVDHDVQRGLDQRRVDKMAAAFDPEAAGVLTVSSRTNGTYHVVDGQHRHAAARIALGDNAKLQCRVFVGLSTQDEARLFRLLNNTAKPQALDLFRVRIAEGEASAVAIERIITAHGWKLDFASSDHRFVAVTAADRIYRADPDAVERSISTITRAWGHNDAGSDGRVFEGIGLFFARYGAAVDAGSLVERIAVFPGGPRALLGKARGLADLIGCTTPKAVAEILVELYNARRKTKALPAWRS